MKSIQNCEEMEKEPFEAAKNKIKNTKNIQQC